ncbi:MAG: hypothetical protein ABSG26_04905 [Bryobacteraceae bacterium]
MKAPHWTMLGLSLDVMGGFFLAAEAIKIPNLQKLRDSFLRPVHGALLPTPYPLGGATSSEAPRTPLQTASDRGETFVVRLRPRWNRRGWRFRLINEALHVLAGAVLLTVAAVASHGGLLDCARWAASWILHLPLLPRILLFPVTVALGYNIVWLAGELVHSALVRVSQALITLLEFIDRNTASGVIGILGFLFLFLGFLLQMFASYLAL